MQLLQLKLDMFEKEIADLGQRVGIDLGKAMTL